MFRSSFPIGRIFGVELRVHVSLPPLLALALIYSDAMTGSLIRGFGLCLALLLGIIVREVVRALAAAYKGLQLRALLVFPVGGIMAFASTDSGLDRSTRLITLITPIANFAAGGLILGLCYGIDPNVKLLSQPWISANHILRSIVWTQFALGAAGLLPIAGFTARKLPLPRPRKESTTPNTRVITINISTLVALALITAGFILMNLWVLLLGGFLFLASRLRTGASLESTSAGNLLVRDAMQKDFKLLSSAETLLHAFEHSTSSVQEIFPVVRGDRLVGSITRSALLARLRFEGDGYIQGVMDKNPVMAFPDELVTTAFRRSASGGSSELIAVVDDGVLLGILTQQGMLSAMQRQATLRTFREREQESSL